MSSADTPSDETGEKVVNPDADPTDVEEPAGAESGVPEVAETAETGEISDAEAAAAARGTTTEASVDVEQQAGDPAPEATPPPAAAEASAEPEPEPEPEPVDELRQGLVDALRAELGDALVDHHIRVGDDVWVRVDRAAWRQAAEVARDKLACDYFCFLSAIDWKPSPFGRGEDDPTEPPVQRSTDVVQGYAGGETRFQVFGRLSSTTRHYGITLKADLDDDEPVVDSWAPVYAGANWHERETWEMYGIRFAGHPDLRHLYLPGEFEGFPLRKDYPLLARMVKPWPGIVDVEAMPTEEGEAAEEEAAEETAEAEAEA